MYFTCSKQTLMLLIAMASQEDLSLLMVPQKHGFAKQTPDCKQGARGKHELSALAR